MLSAVSRLLGVNNKELTTGTSCDSILKLGDYSESCFIHKNGKTMGKIPSGLFMTFIDFCTVPFSFTVLSVTDDLYNISRFTETKSDVVIPVMKTNRNRGLLLDVKIDETDPTLYEVVLTFNTTDKIAFPLTRKMYESGVGMMCPLHECQQTQSRFKKVCHPFWIDYENTTYRSNISISYDPCDTDKYLSAGLVVFLNSTNLPFHHTLTVDAYRKNDLEEGDHSKTLHLGVFYEERQSGVESNNGYMLLDYGNLTLYGSRNFTERIVQLTVRILHVL